MNRSLLRRSTLLFAIILAAGSRADAAANVQELRVQKVGPVTYFHVRLEPLRDLASNRQRLDGGWFVEPSPSQAPKQVAAKGEVRLVCQRLDPDRNPWGV